MAPGVEEGKRAPEGEGEDGERHRRHGVGADGGGAGHFTAGVWGIGNGVIGPGAARGGAGICHRKQSQQAPNITTSTRRPALSERSCEESTSRSKTAAGDFLLLS